jgi:hypothetical protein
VNESSLVSTAWDDIHAIDKTPVAGDHNLFDAIPTDVVEYSRNTQTDTCIWVAVADHVGLRSIGSLGILGILGRLGILGIPGRLERLGRTGRTGRS